MARRPRGGKLKRSGWAHPNQSTAHGRRRHRKRSHRYRVTGGKARQFLIQLRRRRDQLAMRLEIDDYHDELWPT